MVQVTLARLLATEIEELVGCPHRTGARSEIELDPMFVGVEPGVEQEGFQSHQATAGQLDVAGEDPANRPPVVRVKPRWIITCATRTGLFLCNAAVAIDSPARPIISRPFATTQE